MGFLKTFCLLLCKFMTEAGQRMAQWSGNFFAGVWEVLEKRYKELEVLERSMEDNDFYNETSSLFWISQIIAAAYFAFLLLPLHLLPSLTCPSKQG